MAKFLAEMTWVEAGEAARQGAIVMLPLSPTEEHGPHLPLATDWMEAEAIATRAADLLAVEGIDALIAPTISHAVAQVARDFPGNICIRPETLESLIVDVCASLASHGFDKQAVVCMHFERGNRETVLRAVDFLREKHNLNVIEAFVSRQDRWWPRLAQIVETDLTYDLHAGEMETSVMLALRPDLVRPGWEKMAPVLVDLRKELTRDKVFSQLPGGAQGYFGDPTRSSSEKGRAILDLWAQSVADAVAELVKG